MMLKPTQTVRKTTKLQTRVNNIGQHNLYAKAPVNVNKPPGPSPRTSTAVQTCQPAQEIRLHLNLAIFTRHAYEFSVETVQKHNLDVFA